MKQNNKNNKSPNIDDSLLTNSSFKVYKGDNNLMRFLGNLVLKDKGCEYYKSNGNCYIFKVLEQNECVILLSSVSLENYDFSDCIGVFEYNKVLFFYKGRFLENLFTVTNETKAVTYNKTSLSEIPIIDDSKSYWYFSAEDAHFVLIEEVLCGFNSAK